LITTHQRGKRCRQGSKFKKMSSIDSARRVLQNEYHISWGFGLTHGRLTNCSAFTHRAKARPRAQKSVFILSKFIKIFGYPHFYAGNTMALLFFHETFGKIEFSLFCDFLMFPNFPKIFVEIVFLE
jgi:hypothetical protein